MPIGWKENGGLGRLVFGKCLGGINDQPPTAPGLMWGPTQREGTDRRETPRGGRHCPSCKEAQGARPHACTQGIGNGP